ncbi:MBL fold metallo-hydrolase [Chloroflexota bacterium]
MIFRRLVVGPYASNCYIIGSETTKEGIIIDPGAEAEEILKVIEALGLEIKLIVLTHGHMDHIGALKKVQEATGAEVAVHTDDTGFLQEQHVKLRLLRGGDSIDFGDMHFSVLHTPGHSPGSICLLGHGVLFSGDTLFNFGIGRYDIAGGSYSQIMNSLHTKLMVLPDNIAAYPGHGPDTTIGTERQGNPFLR